MLLFLFTWVILSLFAGSIAEDERPKLFRHLPRVNKPGNIEVQAVKASDNADVMFVPAISELEDNNLMDQEAVESQSFELREAVPNSYWNTDHGRLGRSFFVVAKSNLKGGQKSTSVPFQEIHRSGFIPSVSEPILAASDRSDLQVMSHRRNPDQFARDFVRQNIHEPLPMNEVLNDITDLYERLPKPLQVIAAPNFGSLIKTMHSIKYELDRMQRANRKIDFEELESVNDSSVETTTRVEVRTLPTPQMFRQEDSLYYRRKNAMINEHVTTREDILNSRKKLETMIGNQVDMDQDDLQRRLDGAANTYKHDDFVPSKPIPMDPMKQDKSDAIFYSDKPISDQEYLMQKLNSIKTIFKTSERPKTTTSRTTVVPTPWMTFGSPTPSPLQLNWKSEDHENAIRHLSTTTEISRTHDDIKTKLRRMKMFKNKLKNGLLYRQSGKYKPTVPPNVVKQFKQYRPSFNPSVNGHSFNGFRPIGENQMKSAASSQNHGFFHRHRFPQKDDILTSTDEEEIITTKVGAGFQVGGEDEPRRGTVEDIALHEPLRRIDQQQVEEEIHPRVHSRRQDILRKRRKKSKVRNQQADNQSILSVISDGFQEVLGTFSPIASGLGLMSKFFSL